MVTLGVYRRKTRKGKLEHMTDRAKAHQWDIQI